MKISALGLIFMLFCAGAMADFSGGEKTVMLATGTGENLAIGGIEFRRDGAVWRFKFTPRESVFSDHFLSMRPFKCIEGETMYCHLAYPYDKPQTLMTEDFVNLEYEFLFILRSPNEYGIDPYQGRYFVIRQQDGNLVGEARAVDLNILAAPPDAGVTRPITEAELDIIELETERFPRLIIK